MQLQNALAALTNGTIRALESQLQAAALVEARTAERLTVASVRQVQAGARLLQTAARAQEVLSNQMAARGLSDVSASFK